MIHRISMSVDFDEDTKSQLHESVEVISPDIEILDIPYASITETIAVGTTMIMETMSDCQVFQTQLDEAIIESAFEDHEQMVLLCEAGTKGFFEMIRKLFTRMVEVAKSLVNKVSIYLTKLMGRTEAWAKKIEPTIREAMTDTKNRSITYDMYNWDRNFIKTGMLDASNKIGEKYGGSNYGSDFAKDIEQMRSGRVTVSDDQTIVTYKNQEGKDRAFSGSNKTESDVDQQDTISLELLKNAREAFSTQDARFRNAKTFQEILDMILLTAHGGENEKSPNGFFSDANDMLSTLKTISKTVSEIKKGYQSHLTNLTAAKTAVDRMASSFTFSDNAEVQSDQSATAVTTVRKVLSHRAKQITAYYNASNTISKLNITCINGMISDYMGALNALAKTVKKTRKGD